MIDIFNEIGFINQNGGTEKTVKGEQISVNNASEQGSVVSMTEYVDPSQNLNGQTRPYPEMGGSNILPGADNVKNWVISGSGDVVNFYPYNMSSSSPWNLKTLKTTLSPVQDLSHGDPSPTNICPISGWDGVNTTVAGKNLLDISEFVQRSGYSNLSVSIDDGTIEITGYNAGGRFACFNIPLKIGQSYAVKYTERTNVNGVSLVQNDTKPTAWISGGTGIGVNATYTFTATKPWAQIWTELSADNATIKNLQIELGTTATTYEPYNGTTYPVNLSDTAGTVYGGTLDVVSGELTVTDANIASYNGETLPSTWISDRDVYASGTTPTTGAQVVYKLATPLTYQLTPTQIAMIVGNNYIWTDCGTIEDASYYVSNPAYTAYMRADTAGAILNTSKISAKFFSNTNRTLSFEHTATAALTVDIILAGTSGTASDNVWTRTKWGYLAQGVSLSRTSTWTRYTLPATAFNEAKLTQGSGDVNSFYIQIVPSGKVDLRRFELENGSTATAWTPSSNHATLLNTSNLYLYKRSTPTASGTSYNKSLGRSVYYGKLEFKSGTLTVLGAVVTLNSTNQTWQSQTSGSNMRFYASISGMKSSTDASETLCTDFASTTSTSYTSPWGYYRISGTSIYISNYYYTQASGTKFFDTLADFKAWLDARETAGSPVQLLYPLATPQTYSLGTTTINLLSGMNYFDSGTTNRRIVEGKFSDPYLGLKRPSDFAIQREDIYAGEYTTCTGAVKADRIGWKYSDMEIVFDELTESELQFLIGMNDAVTFIFADSDGQHQENVIRAGFSNTPTRLTLPDGQAIWKNAGLSIRFIDAHN